MSQKMVRISIGSHGAAVILHRRKWYVGGYGVRKAQYGNIEYRERSLENKVKTRLQSVLNAELKCLNLIQKSLSNKSMT